jgi:hypothetical protein
MTPGPSTLRTRSARAALVVLATIGLAAVASACSSSSSPSSAASASASCSGVAGAHHARVVVEVSPSKVLSRCVGFSSASIGAVPLLDASHFELGTQQFSFGLAICQIDNVPAHYSQCLPSGADYWALFVSQGGSAWTNPSVGVSDITLHDGDSLGFRYDSPNGNPAPPPTPSRA